MAKYHISPDGTPRPCDPVKTGVCRYGEDTPHFSTADDARVAYEASQNGSFSSTKLRKRAYEADDVFSYNGVLLASDTWTYVDGSGTFGNQESIRLTADGVDYAIGRPYDGKYFAEILLEDKHGWSSTRGTKMMSTLQEVTDEVERRAMERAKKKWPELNLNDEAIREHLRSEKLRYDSMDADGNVPASPELNEDSYEDIWYLNGLGAGIVESEPIYNRLSRVGKEPKTGEIRVTGTVVNGRPCYLATIVQRGKIENLEQLKKVSEVHSFTNDAYAAASRLVKDWEAGKI